MYPDPTRIKTVRVTVRLDQYEHKLLESMAEYQGEQLSTLVRGMAMAQAREIVGAVAGCNDMAPSVAAA